MTTHGVVFSVKNGQDYKGSQKFHCKNCGRYATLQAQKGYSWQRKDEVKRAVLERNRLRGLARIFAMSKQTIMNWLQKGVY